jgi:hypothetical protein
MWRPDGSKSQALHLCLCPGVYFLKWDDQSHFRDLFAMEWYVLGNEWDYSAVNPDMEDIRNSSDMSLFGLQYSEYYNGTGAGKASVPQVDRKEEEALFNQINNWEESATKNLFTGKLDGKLFAPLRFDYGSVYASMAFRTEDKRQVLFIWIVESAAGNPSSCLQRTSDWPWGTCSMHCMHWQLLRTGAITVMTAFCMPSQQSVAIIRLPAARLGCPRLLLPCTLCLSACLQAASPCAVMKCPLSWRSKASRAHRACRASSTTTL